MPNKKRPSLDERIRAIPAALDIVATEQIEIREPDPIPPDAPEEARRTYEVARLLLGPTRTEQVHVSRLNLANQLLQGHRAAALNRETRQAARDAAAVLWGWEGSVEKLRQLANSLPPPMYFAPDQPAEFDSFWRAIEQVVAAIDNAVAAVPQTARREWARDEVDGAASHKRINSAAIGAILAAGFPQEASIVADVARAAGGLELTNPLAEDPTAPIRQALQRRLKKKSARPGAKKRRR